MVIFIKKWVKIVLKLIQQLGLERAAYYISRNRVLSNFLITHYWESNKSLLDYYKLYSQYLKLAGKAKINLENSKILEIGSGSSFGAAIFFTRHNIDSWVSIDKYNEINSASEITKANEFLRKYPAKKYKRFFIYNKEKIINFTNNLLFLKKDILNINLPKNHFDVVFSNVVLEHIEKEDVETVIKNIKRGLKSGGKCISVIDLGDHFNVLNPFNFYKYSEKEWHNLTSNTIMYTNRLRAVDFIELFEKNGFKLVVSDFKRQKLGKKVKLSADFNKYTRKDLETCLVKLVFKNN